MEHTMSPYGWDPDPETDDFDSLLAGSAREMSFGFSALERGIGPLRSDGPHPWQQFGRTPEPRRR